MSKGKRAPSLPKQQLTILAICRFGEPVAMTSVYPYIPEMVQSFNIPTDEVAKWAGLLSAVFSLSQCLTGIAWGRASDKFGRKPMIVLALTCTMISSVLFGFSRSLVWAFITRSLQGLSNGNVGIIRTAVAEMVTEKELQPRAFSIMPLVWTVGSIFGPALGGSLVHPVERFPALFRGNKLLKEYPFALPNLLISTLFVIGITQGILFLHETLDEKKKRKDYGLVLGSFLTRSCRRRKQSPRLLDPEEDAPFLGSHGNEMSSTPTKTTAPKLPAPKTGWAQVFTRQSNINLAVYTFLAMHSVAYDQLLPIFMHHPVQSRHNPDVHLPLKFAGGFGIESNQIGLWFMIYGIYGMCIQFAIFPYIARKYGVLNTLKGCSLMFPFVYIATPFTALLPTSNLRQGVNFCLMLVKGFCGICSFPCSTILLTNSATSLKILGTLNGVATSISALGRAGGPALAGATFTLGVDIGYVVCSWWTLAIIAIIAAIPVWWLVEMEGFNSSEEVVDETEDEDVIRVTATESLDGRQRKGSSIVVSGDVFEDPGDVAEESALLSATDTNHSEASRQQSPSLVRTTSPIGFGPGIGGQRARRYSSDLGATRSGLGTGGTSYH